MNLTKNRTTLALLAVLLLLAAILRFAFLGSMEFWWDEFVTLGRSLPDIPDLLRGLMYQSPNVATDCSPPLHQLLVHFIMMFGRSEFIIKTPSVLCGLATIVFVFLIGKSLFAQRVGFFSALFCTVSLFHIYYSRDIRWYSVYYAFSLGGLYFLVRAIASNAWKHWLLFSLFLALSLYASYTGATFLAGEVLYISGLVCVLVWKGDRSKAGTMAPRAGLALLVALVLYSPWTPAQYLAFLSFKGKGAYVPFKPEFFKDTFRFFLEYFYQGNFNHLWIAAPLGLCGLAAALSSRASRGGVLLVSCWALIPVVAVYFVKTEFGLSPKYVMSLFYYLAFALGLGLNALARGIEKLTGRFSPAWGYALALTLLAASVWPNIHYLSFYQGKTSSHKDLIREVALSANPGDYLLYENSAGLSFVGCWYLQEAFPTARGRLGREYKRALLVSESPRALAGFPPYGAQGLSYLPRGLGQQLAAFAGARTRQAGCIPG